jgi:DNA polymerase-3 subunit alpha (Gram-positive type)
MIFTETEEFKKLESEYPLLRHAREHFSGLHNLSCVIIDTETTGLEPQVSEIIEIAGLKVLHGEIQEPFNSLIKIDRPLPDEIIKITGITDEILKGGEQKNFVFQRFVDFVQDLPLVAHNVEFDLPFLQYHLGKTINTALNNQTICTLKLSRNLLPSLPSHKLAKMAGHFNIPTPNTHRALGDVEITYQLWLKLADMLEKNGIHSLEDLQNSGKMK